MEEDNGKKFSSFGGQDLPSRLRIRESVPDTGVNALRSAAEVYLLHT